MEMNEPLRSSEEPGLRARVAKGIFWNAAENWGIQAISFVVFLVLARLLGPESFGLVAYGSLFIAFVQTFLDQGMADAIVQRHQVDREHLDTAFWTSVGTGLIFTIIGFLGAPLIAAFFNEERLTSIVRWMSLTFLFSGFSTTQGAILRRHMAFKSLAIRSFFAVIAGGGAGVTMAFLGFGIWALVVQRLVYALVAVVTLWRVSDWRPGLSFSRKHFKDLFAFGGSLVVSNLLGFFSTRSDRLFVGYFLGPLLLGYYTIASRILQMMIELFANSFKSVTFSAFSRIQTDLDRTRRAFYKVTQMTSALAFPAFLLLVVVGSELVCVLYGEKWLPSVVPMQILMFAGVLHSVFFFNMTIILAAGKSGTRLVIATVNSIANVVAYIIVARWGLVAVALAFVVRAYLVSPLPLWVVHRLIKFNVVQYFKQYASPVIACVAMIISVLIVKQFLTGHVGSTMLLGSELLVGACVYFLTIRFTSPPLFGEIRDFIRSAFPQPA